MGEAGRTPGLSLLLPFVLVSFAANSLITRYVVRDDLLDAGLLTAIRFVAGAAALIVLSVVRRERVRIGRGNVTPALWLGIYAVCISYGYQHIGAAAGTFVFYAAVLLTLVLDDRRRGTQLPARRLAGAGIALAGIAVLATASIDTVTPLGVGLLLATGVAWGLYTAAGRTADDPRTATTGHFTLLAVVMLLPAGAGLATSLRVTTEGVAWAIVMGAGTTAFAYVAWYACQRALTGAQAGLVQLVIPVLTTVGAVALLGEPLSARLLVAAALVGAGMYLGRAAPASLPGRPGVSPRTPR